MMKSPRILVVEDDPQVRQVNFLILKGAGYEVDVAVDGWAGWEALHEKQYDLVLTDNAMPRLRGVQLIHKMREEGMTTPVIIASAFLSKEDEIDALELSVDGKLGKPFRMDELLKTVNSVLSHKFPPRSVSMWGAV